MSGKSPVTVTMEQREALDALSASHERGEADRARAILLTAAGWTSAEIAEAFGVREDTVRFWRSTFLSTGVDGLRRQVSSGP
ncbi:MAG: helix-turn-helix domain-containing protein, partial [Planctomycetaceae bacterium]